MATKTDITLYTAATPNGIKITILLAALNLDYKVHSISFSDNEQKQPWFLEINPNGRIPAITDVLPGGKKIRVFESGAIMQYLVDRYDKENKFSYAPDSPEHWEVTSWLMWQMGGLGPMRGQANHFKVYAKDKIPYAIDRYVNESRRLFRALDTTLASASSGYLVGDRLTVADIAIWPWVIDAKSVGIDTHEFPNLRTWAFRLLEHPAVEKGRHIPEPHKWPELESLTEEQLEERAAKNHGWILSGMKDDAK